MRTRSHRWAAIAAAIAFSPLALAAPPAMAPASGASTAPHAMQHSGWQHGSQWHGDRHSMRMLDQLDLTTSQRGNLHKLMEQDRAAARPERQALMEKRKAFASATPGTAEYDTATSALAKAESQAAEARVTRHAKLRAGIYAELTPAQRTKLASLHDQRQQQMRNWRQSHPTQMHHRSQPAASSAATH